MKYSVQSDFNPTAVSISICNAKNALIGLQILILYAAGLQIQPNGEAESSGKSSRTEKTQPNGRALKIAHFIGKYCLDK